MKLLQVNYDCALPQDDAHRAEALMSAAYKIAQLPGLIWKIWIYNDEAQVAGGLYLFDTETDARSWGDGPMEPVLSAHPRHRRNHQNLLRRRREPQRRHPRPRHPRGDPPWPGTFPATELARTVFAGAAAYQARLGRRAALAGVPADVMFGGAAAVDPGVYRMAKMPAEGRVAVSIRFSASEMRRRAAFRARSASWGIGGPPAEAVGRGELVDELVALLAGLGCCGQVAAVGGLRDLLVEFGQPAPVLVPGHFVDDGLRSRSL